MKSFEVPSIWYKGAYADKAQCCSAARPFSLVHDEKPAECWLVIHGYRGYPGEMVRPAQDLYDAGFDVFVPRLPGHGTTGDDFMRSRGSDWLAVCWNALSYLKGRYSKVNILGHSMGASMAAITGCSGRKVGKLVFLCPAFRIPSLNSASIAAFRCKALCTKRIPSPWQPDPAYRMHYENAPCDDAYLGAQYWSFTFPRQMIELWRIMRRGVKALSRMQRETLLVNGLSDPAISMPSAELYREILGPRANVADIANGTHCIQYDKDPKAESDAISAVVAFATGEKEPADA